MPYTPHQVEKAEKVGGLIAGLVEDQITLPQLFTKKTFDVIKGAEGDSVTYRVPGRLPYRRYAWRNNRANPIFFDAYKEGKVSFAIGDSLYSAIQVTDEQAEFDLESWVEPANLQADAVAQGIQDECVKALETAPYPVTIGLAGSKNVDDFEEALFEAKRVMDKLRVPKGARFMALGSTLAALARKVSARIPGRAEAALAQGAIGEIATFTIYEELGLDDDKGFAWVPSAFVFYNSAPYVPQSVPFGKLIGTAGVKMRWLRQYDLLHKQDQSLIDAYVTVAPVEDMFFERSIYTVDAPPVVLEPATEAIFVRGLAISLNGPSTYPDSAGVIAIETEVSETDAFVVPSLNAIDFPPTTALALGVNVNIEGRVLKVTTAGTTAGTAPAVPGAVGGTVVSGTVTFTRTV